MNQQFTDLKTAETNLLAAAALLAENIKSSDGYAEAMKEIVPRYLLKNNVDLAAELADSIADPFVRDQLLVIVADKCAAIGDHEYALQLAEAIEDSSFAGAAYEQIGKQNAKRGEIEKAFEIANSVAHPSNIYADIAAEQDRAAALQTIEKIEFPMAQVSALVEISRHSNDAEVLENAVPIAAQITHPEERVRAYLLIAFQFIEVNRNDRAIANLDKAREYAETLDKGHKDSFLSQICMALCAPEVLIWQKER